MKTTQLLKQSDTAFTRLSALKPLPHLTPIDTQLAAAPVRAPGASPSPIMSIDDELARLRGLSDDLKRLHVTVEELVTERDDLRRLVADLRTQLAIARGNLD
jgi:hypothetical protein